MGKLVIGFVLAILLIIGVPQYIALNDGNVKLVNTEVSSAITPERAQKVFDELWKYTGYPFPKPSFRIAYTQEINAYADFSNNEVSVTLGMLQYVHSEDELAGVIGHEIGHILLQHDVLNPMSDPNTQTILEGNADKFGIYLVLRAGYNVCAYQDLWERIRNDEGDYEVNADHPNFSYRLWELQFPMCQGA